MTATGLHDTTPLAWCAAPLTGRLSARLSLPSVGCMLCSHCGLGALVVFRPPPEACLSFPTRPVSCNIEMYSDLKMWQEAKQICPNDDNLKDLIRRQARWAEEIGDWQEAAQMWVQSGGTVAVDSTVGARMRQAVERSSACHAYDADNTSHRAGQSQGIRTELC